MKYRTRWTWPLLVAGLMMGFASVAAAQCSMHAMAGDDKPAAPGSPMPMMGQPGACGPMGGSMMGMMGMMKDCLGLTEDQQKAIEKIGTDAQSARVALRKEMMRLRNSMQGEMLKDDPDAAAARKLLQRMGEIRTQMQIQGLDQRMAIRKLLTPEQRDKAIMMRGCCQPGGRGGMRRMHPMMGAGRGGRQGGPGCGGAGCGHMKGMGGGPDVGFVPTPEPGMAPNPDLSFVPDPDDEFDFDLGLDWLGVPDGPDTPEPPMDGPAR